MGRNKNTDRADDPGPSQPIKNQPKAQTVHCLSPDTSRSEGAHCEREIELYFKEMKSTLGFAQYSFQDFLAVRAWVEMAITTVLFLEYERIKHIQDRRLSKEARRWWEAQRLHGLCHAYRQECQGSELKYLSDRLKTSGGIQKLKSLLANAER